MPDGDAIRAMLDAAGPDGQVEVLDIAAALVIAQAMRLEVDALEADVLDRLRNQAAKYLKAAGSYRDMASRYRDIGRQLP